MTPLLRLLFLAFLLLPPLDGRAAESYTFDPADIEKKPWHFGGYVELRPVLSGLDRDSALYKLQYYAQER
ncbi:MAG: hypothetical protein QMD32_01845, partial [Smithellaceae bacterium]|nr:hypothetical protein [Smithellaceae bacterium]